MVCSSSTSPSRRRGSYPLDILKPNELGADVKMLSCKVDKNDNLKNGNNLLQLYLKDSICKVFLKNII